MGAKSTPFGEVHQHPLVNYFKDIIWCNPGMAISDIRRAMLKRLVEDQGLTVAAARLGKPASQISDMIAGRKSFGEKVARAMELHHGGLTAGWFDGENTSSNVNWSLDTPAPDKPTPTGLHATLMALGAALSSCDVADREIASAVLKNLALQPERAAEFADKLEGLLGGGGHEQPLLRQNGR